MISEIELVFSYDKCVFVAILNLYLKVLSRVLELVFSNVINKCVLLINCALSVVEVNVSYQHILKVLFRLRIYIEIGF